MGEGEGRGASNSCVHPSSNRHAMVVFFMRAIACIMFPSFHAAVGAHSRLDAVSSIIASSLPSYSSSSPRFLTRATAEIPMCDVAHPVAEADKRDLAASLVGRAVNAVAPHLGGAGR